MILLYSRDKFKMSATDFDFKEAANFTFVLCRCELSRTYRNFLCPYFHSQITVYVTSVVSAFITVLSFMKSSIISAVTIGMVPNYSP